MSSETESLWDLSDLHNTFQRDFREQVKKGLIGITSGAKVGYIS